MKNISILILCLFLLGQPAEAKKWRAKHVVLIGIDGWGSFSIPDNNNIPNIRSLMAGGCYTLEKRSVLPSASAINWSSMFNGVPTEMHGYTKWNSRTPEIPSVVTNEHGMIPTIFSVMRQQCPDAYTACLFDWEGIKYVVDTLSISYFGQSKKNGNPDLTTMAVRCIKDAAPAFMAVCYGNVDHAGHETGFGSEAYYEELAKVDGFVGRIIQALKDTGIYDDTVIIMTGDHGGIEKGHGGQTIRELQSPFVICGKGIRTKGQISDVVIQYDTAATIAEIFRLDRPQHWRGQPLFSAFK